MLKALAPGFLLTVVLGVAAYYLATLHDTLDALVVALLAGMLIRLIFGRQAWFILAVAYAKDLKNFLIPLGVLFYSATINFSKSLELPGSMYVHTFLSLFVILFTALLLGRLFRLPAKTNWLTAVGSAICGASAIAITSTAVDAKDDDVSNSLIAITLVGLLAVVLYQTLPLFTALDRETYAVLSGATLHQTGMVKIATASLGNLAKDVALPVKVIRTALIPYLALFFFALAVSREGYKKGMGYILMVLMAFILILGLTAFVPAFSELTKVKGIKIAATIIFSVAFANLGLLVDFKTMKLRPVIVALLAWAVAVAVFFVTL